uniref:Uncharacterized protein n=1 Tax=Takifugu rubripes TaxID=31033 RepID=A0A674NSR7_TAKRU
SPPPKLVKQGDFLTLKDKRRLVPERRGRPLTDRIWSPRFSSPLRSAGPPARMKETKIPSPSSPPTMLKPRPVEPLWSTTFLGSLYRQFSIFRLGWTAMRGGRQRYNR